MDSDKLICLFLHLFFFGFFFWTGWMIGSAKYYKKFKEEFKKREEYETSLKIWDDYINAMKGANHEK